MIPHDKSTQCLYDLRSSENVFSNLSAFDSFTIPISRCDYTIFMYQIGFPIFSLLFWGFTIHNMESILNRLASFVPWVEAINPSHLSSRGFYYGGHDRAVVCYLCQLEIERWTTLDELFELHRVRSPRCSDLAVDTRHHVTPACHHTQTDSISTERDPGTLICNSTPQPLDVTVTTQSISRPIRGGGGFVDQSSSTSRLAPYEQIQQQSASSQRNVVNLVATPLSSDDANGSGRVRPKHPQFHQLAARIQSFRGKRVGFGQTVEGLAEAGYFHVGPEDNVRCFQCDGGLKNWRPADDPWTEHARWFPRCPFLVARRDQQFIRGAMVPVNQELSEVLSRTPSGSHTTNNLPSAAAPNVGSIGNDGTLDSGTVEALDENRQLKEARTCKVCMDQEVDTVFLPCGHLVCCSNCSPALRNCAICRALIRGTVKIFLS